MSEENELPDMDVLRKRIPHIVQGHTLTLTPERLEEMLDLIDDEWDFQRKCLEQLPDTEPMQQLLESLTINACICQVMYCMIQALFTKHEDEEN